MSTGLQSKIKELKSLPGKDIIIWGSISIVQQAMKYRLVDDLYIHICPIITGGGRRLLTDENQTIIKLVHSKHFDNGVVSLHYRI